MDKNKPQNGEGASQNNNGINPEEISSLKEEIAGLKELFEKAQEQDETTYVPQKETEQPTDIWEKFDREPPKSYKEIKDAVKLELQREKEAEEARRENYQKEQSERVRNLNKKWDNEISTLERAGKLPKIIDPTNVEDEGVKARMDLYKMASELGSSDLIKVYDYAYAPSKAKAKPVGNKAPVGGSQGSTTGTQGKSRNYSDLKRNIEDVKKNYFPDME
jgi:hypothetical protein